MDSNGTERWTALALLSFIAGIFTIVFAASAFVQPDPYPPSLALASFQNNGSLFAFGSFAAALFALTVIPYFAVLGWLLRPRGGGLSSVATLLSVIGTFSSAISATLGNFALAQAASVTALTPADAIYQAGFWYWTLKDLAVMGFMMLGLGFAIFGGLAWKSGVLPNWLAALGIVGGLSNLLIFNTVAYPVMSVGFIGPSVVEPAALTLWAFATGVLFARRRGRLAPA